MFTFLSLPSTEVLLPTHISLQLEGVDTQLGNTMNYTHAKYTFDKIIFSDFPFIESLQLPVIITDSCSSELGNCMHY